MYSYKASDLVLFTANNQTIIHILDGKEYRRDRAAMDADYCDTIRYDGVDPGLGKAGMLCIPLGFGALGLCHT